MDAILGLLNKATAHLTDFIPWQRAALNEMLSSFRSIADPELFLFAEVKGEAVGWFPATPGLADRMGAQLYKRYRVYRRLLAL